MSKLDALSVRRRIETTFSDRELYRLFDEVSYLYESRMISQDDLSSIKRVLLSKLNRLTVLRKQLNRIAHARKA